MLTEFHCSSVREGQAGHCHDQIEIFQVTAGQGELRVGRSRYSTNPNILAVIGPQESHAGSPASAHFGVRGLLIDPSHAEKLGLDWRAFVPRGNPVVDSEKLMSVFETATLGIRHCPSTMHREELMVVLCENQCKNNLRSRRKESRIGQVIEILRSSPESDVGLAALARTVGLGPAYLCRAFRSIVGVPPHAYRNRLRVARAVTLMKQGLATSDAALAVGFFDQSHLARHMKAQLGQTPAELKRSISSKTHAANSSSLTPRTMMPPKERHED